ncbi:MAG: hypothetical protein WEE66_06400 [Actinomycetota bacterium]
MAENEQVGRLEPSRADRFGDVREAGRKGGMQKEANWQARVAENREALMALAPEAIETVGDVMRGAKRPNVLPAAVAVLDRTDLGPTTKTQVTVGPNEQLVELIQQLDAHQESERAVQEGQGAGSTSRTSTRREVIDVLSHSSQAKGELEAGGPDQASDEAPATDGSPQPGRPETRESHA